MTQEPRPALLLGRALRSRIEALAVAAYPDEACGLLIGSWEDAATRVVEVAPARNLARDAPRRRYEVDPVDQLAAEERARALGLAVVGVWHSHPDHPAEPSERDRAEAWEGYSYAIVPVAEGAAGELRSWRLDGARFVEERVDRA